MASAERALMCSMNFEFNIEHAYPYVYEVVETCGKKGKIIRQENKIIEIAMRFLSTPRHATAGLMNPHWGGGEAKTLFVSITLDI